MRAGTSRPRPVLPVPGPQVLCRFQDGTSAFRYSTDTHHDSRRRHLTRRLPLFPSCLSSSRTVHPTTTPTSTLTSPHAPSPPQCSPRDRNKNPQGIKSTTAARLGRDSRAASDTAWTTALALAISRELSTSFRRPGLKPSLPPLPIPSHTLDAQRYAAPSLQSCPVSTVGAYTVGGPGPTAYSTPSRIVPVLGALALPTQAPRRTPHASPHPDTLRRRLIPPSPLRRTPTGPTPNTRRPCFVFNSRRPPFSGVLRPSSPQYPCIPSRLPSSVGITEQHHRTPARPRIGPRSTHDGRRPSPWYLVRVTEPSCSAVPAVGSGGKALDSPRPQLKTTSPSAFVAIAITLLVSCLQLPSRPASWP